MDTPGQAAMPSAPPTPSDAIDLRDLDPPEPLMRILDAISAGAKGPFVFLLSREPLPLYGILARDGFRHAVRRDAHGVELTVFRDARVP